AVRIHEHRAEAHAYRHGGLLEPGRSHDAHRRPAQRYHHLQQQNQESGTDMVYKLVFLKHQ
ncbi:hypothetical protein AVEN_157991-1, partial [Araneus ventricosus]